MKRGLSIALAVAAALNLWALPAGPLAQQPPAGLQITAPPVGQVGQDVTLTVAAPPATATRYEWQASGAVIGSQQPSLTTRFSQPGAVVVEVRAFDANGQIGAGQVTVEVQAAPSPDPATRGGPKRTAATREGPRSKPKAHHRARSERRVIAAATSSVTIKDFSFGPSSITVHPGDTVNWSNQGNTAHTATASNGSFDTGTLKKGQSGSHTFTSAGTFAYQCSIHPFMHGTVVVAAAAGGGNGSSGTGSGGSGSGGSGSGGGGSAGTTGSGTTPAQPSGGLPNTGLDLGWLLFSGALLIGSGLLLRRATH